MRPQKWDSVRVDGRWCGQVVQDGCTKSLVETDGPEPGTRERLWVENERIEILAHRP